MQPAVSSSRLKAPVGWLQTAGQVKKLVLKERRETVITAGISTTQRTSQRGVDEKGNPSEETQSAPRVSSVGAEDGVG